MKRTGKVTALGTQVSSSDEGRTRMSMMYIEIDGIRLDVSDKIVTIEVD